MLIYQRLLTWVRVPWGIGFDISCLLTIGILFWLKLMVKSRFWDPASFPVQFRWATAQGSRITMFHLIHRVPRRTSFYSFIGLERREHWACRFGFFVLLPEIVKRDSKERLYIIFTIYAALIYAEIRWNHSPKKWFHVIRGELGWIWFHVIHIHLLVVFLHSDVKSLTQTKGKINLQ